MMPAAEPSADVCRRNRILGLTLAVWVLAVIVIFVWRFTVAGLPKDGKMVDELQRRGQAAEEPSHE
jgi:hypothetical protein